MALLREHNKRSTVDGSSTLTALAAVPTVALVPGENIYFLPLCLILRSMLCAARSFKFVRLRVAYSFKQLLIYLFFARR